MMKMSRGEKIFEGINIALLVILCIILLYPLVYIVSQSFSSPQDVYFGTVILFPRNLSVVAYQEILKRDEIWRGYLNTIIYAAIGTVISLFLSFTSAYALSRKKLTGRRILMTYFIITMCFSGGIIPLYLLIDTMGLMDTIWAFILPAVLSPWNVIIIRTYMSSSIPFEVQESAMIDGANDMIIFAAIVMPLCKPVLAIMTLFAVVGYWNSYFNALIFISDETKYPLQIILQNILIEKDTLAGSMTDVSSAEQAMISEAIKYSSIAVFFLPIKSKKYLLTMVNYLQKFFQYDRINEA